MKFHDGKKVKYYLADLNYYRLCGYCLLFENNHKTDIFS